jgi:hypothetical protein
MYWHRILAAVIIKAIFIRTDLLMKHLFCAVLAGFYLCGLSFPTQAYMDPNVGSMLLQGILAGLAATGLVIKTYWYRLKAFFTKESARSEESAAQTDEPSEQPPQ